VGKPRPKILIVSAVLLVTAFVVGIIARLTLYESDHRKKQNLHPPSSITDHVKVDAPFDAQQISTLDWQNLGDLMKKLGADAQKLRHLIKETPGAKNPAAIYLRGLLLLIDKKPKRSLAAFNMIEIKDIPPFFLYPPYRLHRHLNPREPNPYLDPLRKAIAAVEVSPLVKARVQIREGKPLSALSSYLQTDPARWVRYDIECLKTISNHPGFHSELRRMIAGALQSGRVEKPMAEALRRIVVLGTKKSEVREFKNRLKQELVQNSRIAKLFVASIAELLETRKLFLEREYKKILEIYHDANPIELPTETILLLFISAVQGNNRLEMDRWGQEIKRRYPFEGAVSWINELTASAN